MRPVRFVALSEDGHALVLADEVGRLLALPIDDRIQGAMRPDREHTGAPLGVVTMSTTPTLAPRDIQARIRAGESAEDVARVAGVPVDRVLRYAGPVLQERAMLAQHARRTKLRTSDKGATLAETVDGRLSQHGIDTDKISWDASRRDDGTWRIVATWPSGKATAQAVWELDKARQTVTPFDDMAHYLCGDRSKPSAEPGARHGHGLGGPARGESSRGELSRHGHEPIRPMGEPPQRDQRLDPRRDGRSEPQRRDPRINRPAAAADPIRAGRDALLASLDTPLGGERATPTRPDQARPGESAQPAARLGESPGRAARGGAAGLISGGPGMGAATGASKAPSSPFDDPVETGQEVPSVPSLAVLRPRRTTAASSAAANQAESATNTSDKPRRRLPSWDDVLFGGAPARESS